MTMGDLGVQLFGNVEFGAPFLIGLIALVCCFDLMNIIIQLVKGV